MSSRNFNDDENSFSSATTRSTGSRKVVSGTCNSDVAPTEAIETDTGPSRQFVTVVKSNDILLGRGGTMVHSKGNLRFRALVRGRKEEYNNACRRNTKDSIAKEIFDVITKQREGRFLRKIESQVEASGPGITDEVGDNVWVIVEDEVAWEKVKQALRKKFNLMKHRMQNMIRWREHLYQLTLLPESQRR